MIRRPPLGPMDRRISRKQARALTSTRRDGAGHAAAVEGLKARGGLTGQFVQARENACRLAERYTIGAANVSSLCVPIFVARLPFE